MTYRFLDVLLRILCRLTLSHNEHFCLCLTAATLLQRLFAVVLCREEAFIEFNTAKQFILAVSAAHCIAQLVHQLPDWLVTLVT